MDNFAPFNVNQKLSDTITSKFPSFFNLEFQLGELEDIIVNAKESSSPGNDLINYTLLKLLPLIARSVIENI